MFFLVDAFTDRKFKGNPAGVFVVQDFPESAKMQKIAGFFKFPDCVFIKQLGEQDFQLRWFSPVDESPICGHGTIAAAHIVFSKLAPKSNQISFKYNKGILRASLHETGLIIDFPLMKSNKCSTIPFDIEKILGIDNVDAVYEDTYLYMIVLNKREDIFRINPNFSAIKRLDKRSMVVTAPGFGHYDFCTRYFAPKVGINEDPVCGSANCRASILWSQRLNKQELLAYQASEREGSLKIYVNLAEKKVSLEGTATTICEFQNCCPTNFS